MSSLSAGDFPAFFRELHKQEPYDWQRRLVNRLLLPRSGNGEKAEPDGWPEAIDLPTGSGKTSCLDIAVFALACQAESDLSERTAPRRIIFCVNRRVIVDEAHQRAVKIAGMIAKAEGEKTVLGRVAGALRTLSTLRQESAPPLDVLELRGGIYRDNRWARSATQPTIICTTIDQLGSRLLFRGYGVSSSAAPIQAGLIAYDSLVLLDEAHISRPFLQTLDSVKRYLDPEKWTEKSIGVRPLIVVPMTATPPEGVSDANVIRIDESKDRENKRLDDRLKASKQARLLKVTDIVKGAVEKGRELVKTAPAAVGILVNRVATAKAIFGQLKNLYQGDPDVIVELVIGSMRPIDRDGQAERLRSLIGTERKEVSERTSFVVSTQCLEVGADYDFDVLVTECASLDALRQRFGRLNRGGRKITAKAVILFTEKDVKEESKLDENKPLDPIYGNAAARTWNWMVENAEERPSEEGHAERKTKGKNKKDTIERYLDFGIDAFKPKWESLDAQKRRELSAPAASKNAPVMLPAYLDFWCRTNPRPTPDPDVALFIHGPEAGEPDVQVCWRADLIEENRKEWCDVVGLLPPTSAECMSVPISRLRRWLTRVEEYVPEGDLLGTGVSDPDDEGNRGARKAKTVESSRIGVLWRGSKDSKVIQTPDDLRPGDTLVLPITVGGWETLGHIPDSSTASVDVAEIAFRAARNRAVLRLHPVLKDRFGESASFVELLTKLSDEEERLTKAELRPLLNRIAEELGTDENSLGEMCHLLAKPPVGFLCENYPDGNGIVLTSRQRLGKADSWYGSTTDDGDDERSRTLREKPISLTDHTEHVRQEILRTLNALPLNEVRDTYERVAKWHDLGKADERFQAMLRRADRTDAWLRVGLNAALLAKSDGLPLTPLEKKQARERAELPEGFRHEMVSVQIVEQSRLKDEADPAQLALLLHLIAAHHGYARPFAPVVFDEECPEIQVASVTLTSEQRFACPSHRIDSGIAERFWELTRRYGWWGAAYLEAVFRLADQQASADEDERELIPTQEKKGSVEVVQ